MAVHAVRFSTSLPAFAAVTIVAVYCFGLLHRCPRGFDARFLVANDAQSPSPCSRQEDVCWCHLPVVKTGLFWAQFGHCLHSLDSGLGQTRGLHFAPRMELMVFSSPSWDLPRSQSFNPDKVQGVSVSFHGSGFRVLKVFSCFLGKVVKLSALRPWPISHSFLCEP